MCHGQNNIGGNPVITGDSLKFLMLSIYLYIYIYTYIYAIIRIYELDSLWNPMHLSNFCGMTINQHGHNLSLDHGTVHILEYFMNGFRYSQVPHGSSDSSSARGFQVSHVKKLVLGRYPQECPGVPVNSMTQSPTHPKNANGGVLKWGYPQSSSILV